jgi:hypothetical protein
VINRLLTALQPHVHLSQNEGINHDWQITIGLARKSMLQVKKANSHTFDLVLTVSIRHFRELCMMNLLRRRMWRVGEVYRATTESAMYIRNPKSD